jgi:hypothetical protein
MTDVEDRFAGYRPSAPPPELRARILRQAEESRPSTLRDWLPALAAAALAIVFYVLGVTTRADIASRLAVPDDLRPVEQWVPDDVGGVR